MYLGGLSFNAIMRASGGGVESRHTIRKSGEVGVDLKSTCKDERNSHTVGVATYPPHLFKQECNKMEEILKNFFEAISPALQALLVALASAIAFELRKLVTEAYKVKRAELSQEQQYLLDMVAQHAVEAAEQIYIDSEDKRQHAINITEKALESYNVKLDLDLVESAVESAVFNLPPTDEPLGEEVG